MTLTRVFGLVATVVDFSGTLIILLAVGLALWRWLRDGATGRSASKVRVALAEILVFALNFKTGAGLIRTITVGSWGQFVPVVLIIAVRFFLGRTLKAELADKSRTPA